MNTANLPGYIRTIVPMIVGWIVSVLTGWGLDADSATVTQLVVAIVGAVYYIIVRLLEKKFPKLGWLLGSPKTPVY